MEIFGEVKFFLPSENWGFISSKSNGDFFVHRKCLLDAAVTLQESDKVAFEAGERKGKPCAKNVRLLDGGQ